jgi:hypothetical protein
LIFDPSVFLIKISLATVCCKAYFSFLTAAEPETPYFVQKKTPQLDLFMQDSKLDEKKKK